MKRKLAGPMTAGMMTAVFPMQANIQPGMKQARKTSDLGGAKMTAVFGVDRATNTSIATAAQNASYNVAGAFIPG